MTQDTINYAVLKGLVTILCTMCAADENKVIDLLTGYLWDKTEAEGIKKSSGKIYK